MKTETLRETAAATPPLSIAGLSLYGVALSDWVLVATLLYTVFLIIDKAPSVLAKLVSGWYWVKEKLNGKERSQ